MDGTRFDAWTRRRFGLVTGGAIASILGLAGPGDVDAGNKKRRRRRRKKNKKTCRKIGQTCNINKKKQRCCKSGQDCAQVQGLDGDRCCKEANSNCKKNTDCCGTRTCKQGTCQN